MGNCLSTPAPSESDSAENDEKSPVHVKKSRVFLLYEFKQQMLKEEDFKFNGHPLVTQYMDEDARQSFGELYGGRKWPPTAEWVKIFNERWTPFRESMTEVPI